MNIVIWLMINNIFALVDLDALKNINYESVGFDFDIIRGHSLIEGLLALDSGEIHNLRF
jgi:hypothetical protein